MRRLGLVGLVLLAGCAGPQVKTAQVPPVEAPDAFRVDLGPGVPVTADWWRSFGDPQLAALVKEALARNADINIAAARVREARAQQDLARSAMLPSLDAALGATDSRTISPFGTPVVQRAAQPQLQAAWEVDLFGRLSDQVSAARSGWLASQAARDAARLSVTSATANAYVTLLALDDRLALAQRTAQIRKGSRDLIKRRVDVGYSPKLELQQAEVDYQAALALVPALEQARAKAENALSVLAGRVPGPVERAEGLAALTKPPVPEALPSELLRRRPDVAQAEYQLAATDSNLAAARKRFLPSLRLSASAGVAFSNLLANPVGLWSIGGSILAPLFEGGRLRAGAEVAGAQRDAAAFAYRKAALTAFREVNDALASVDGLDRQVLIQTAQRDALAEAYRLSSNRYREGYSPLLEQLDTQRGLLSAELALIQTRSDALAARVSLYQALGGGWNAEALATANDR
ncbi:efflux transporter outer membrane subunit [Novosphingobium sp. B1]|uniref:efflux transporter outer membrane subunit n=1 Tax=Novosphingobium sp. B1 TaxID=1938756 RepID=UPI0009D827FC|nr:efflux transporter outer membrane subunit [Novosphingobium sp. B1]SMC41563.1 efflux transporter, outer membrane factor (OMF) lipoprotein, NodT family [Novosphingobium sp. B1]